MGASEICSESVTSHVPPYLDTRCSVVGTAGLMCWRLGRPCHVVCGWGWRIGQTHRIQAVGRSHSPQLLVRPPQFRHLTPHCLRPFRPVVRLPPRESQRPTPPKRGECPLNESREPTRGRWLPLPLQSREEKISSTSFCPCPSSSLSLTCHPENAATHPSLFFASRFPRRGQCMYHCSGRLSWQPSTTFHHFFPGESVIISARQTQKAEADGLELPQMMAMPPNETNNELLRSMTASSTTFKPISANSTPNNRHHGSCQRSSRCERCLLSLQDGEAADQD